MALIGRFVAGCIFLVASAMILYRLNADGFFEKPTWYQAAVTVGGLIIAGIFISRSKRN